MNSMKAVVLAGGSGTRLWSMSRQQLSKQFLKLVGEESLLAATISRLSPVVSQDDVWVVTNEAHAAGEAFVELNHLHTILEPCGRDAAPAIALAAALLQEDGDPLIWYCPLTTWFRPTDIVGNVGDVSKAKRELDWAEKLGLNDIAQKMIVAEMGV